jgi:hypothetical protein
MSPLIFPIQSVYDGVERRKHMVQGEPASISAVSGKLCAQFHQIVRTNCNQVATLFER